jgi:hypothetical protein
MFFQLDHDIIVVEIFVVAQKIRAKRYGRKRNLRKNIELFEIAFKLKCNSRH